MRLCLQPHQLKVTVRLCLQPHQYNNAPGLTSCVVWTHAGCGCAQEKLQCLASQRTARSARPFGVISLAQDPAGAAAPTCSPGLRHSVCMRTMRSAFTGIASPGQEAGLCTAGPAHATPMCRRPQHPRKMRIACPVSPFLTAHVGLPGTRLLVSATNNQHQLFSTLHPEQPPSAVFEGHIAGSFYVRACFSGCGRHILSGSSDAAAYIWEARAAPLCHAALQALPWTGRATMEAAPHL